VARGMAADPPIMLMDEPFGAIDPINRNLLQNEFLRLQEEIQKTILFVTHDIDEAIKMSDKICILNVGGQLEQFDSPANILSNPNNDFVDDFVGADRGLKQLNLIRVEQIMDSNPPLLQTTQAAEEAIAFMREHELGSIYVTDTDQRLKGYVTRRDLRDKSGKVEEFLTPMDSNIEPTTTLRDALSEMLILDYSTACVVDPKKRVQGLVSVAMIQKTIAEGNTNEAEEGQEGGGG
jgi:osmoprotectant transport system ATP-binding protein